MSTVRAKKGAADYSSYQQKRRNEALEKQRDARKSRVDLARTLHQLLQTQDNDVEFEITDAHQEAASGADSLQLPGASTSGSRKRRPAPQRINGMPPREFYAKQLMQPEWMTDIPTDLGSSWTVMPRPEGERCLVTSSRGWTTSRTRAGAVLHRFQGPLPEGSAATQGSPAHSCALDAVFCAARGTYFVTDVISWRGQQLHECTAEFRRFWLDNRVHEDLAAGAAALQAREREQQEQQMQQEQGGGLAPLAPAAGAAAAAAAGDEAMVDAGGAAEAGSACSPAPLLSYAFQLVPAWRCTPEGLRAAYQQPLPFTRDGLLLLHAECLYAAGEPSPLALTWKDAACSRFHIDTDAAGAVPEHQQVTLALQLDGGVATQDEPPVVLGRMPQPFMERLAQRRQQRGAGDGQGAQRPPGLGRLLRFTIRAGGISFHEGRPAGADLHYEGPANQRRGRADLISKVMFQYWARRRPMGLQHLLDAVAHEAAAAAAAADGEQQQMDLSMGDLNL